MAQINPLASIHTAQLTNQSEVESNNRPFSQAQDTLEEKGCFESIGEWFNWLLSLLCCCWQSSQIEESSRAPTPQPTGSTESYDQDNAIEEVDAPIVSCDQGRVSKYDKMALYDKTTLYSKEELKNSLIKYSSINIRNDEKELLSQTVDEIVATVYKWGLFNNIEAEFFRSDDRKCYYMIIFIHGFVEHQNYHFEENLRLIKGIDKLYERVYCIPRSVMFQLPRERFFKSASLIAL